MLFLFSGKNDLEGPVGTREGGKWALDAQLGYLGFHGRDLPYSPGEVTSIPATAGSASQLGQLSHKQVTHGLGAICLNRLRAPLMGKWADEEGLFHGGDVSIAAVGQYNGWVCGHRDRD